MTVVLPRIRVTPAAFLLPVALALAFGILAWVGLEWTRNEQRIATVWLPNAVLVGVLLRSDRRAIVTALPLCWLANLSAGLLAHIQFGQCLAFSLVNAGETALVLALAQEWPRRRLDITDLTDLARFCTAAVIGPVASGLCAMMAAAVLRGSLDLRLWAGWSGVHTLQLLIATPFVVSVIDACVAARRPSSSEIVRGALILGACLAGSIALFAQSHLPLLFLACPFVIGAAFRLGSIGTAIAIAIISTVATIATAFGHGPIMLTGVGLTTRMIVLQLFLATNFAMGLPVAAMLAGLAEARAELQASRDFASSMLENMREVIFRTDREGRWVFLNPAWKQLTGYSPAESLGWRTTRLLHPDDLPAARDLYPSIVAGETSEALLQQRFHDAQGRCRHIEVSIRALHDEQGVFAGTTGSIRDVTEREEAMVVIADREAQLALLAENATDAVFRLALDGECLYASPSVREVLGIDPALLVGRDVLTRFHPDDEAEVLAAYQSLRDGRAERLVVSYRSLPFDRPDWVWLEANCGLVRDQAGASAEIIVSIRDISQRKALEFALKRARDDAQVAAAAKASFLANMSHEIRTPMNGVIGFTELLLDSELSAEQRAHLHLIADSGRTMMRLLNDILDLSKIDAGQMQVARDPVDLRHTLRSCGKLMTPMATRKGLALRVEVADAVPGRIVGDGLRLRQIVLNLLGNAVKFTDEGEVVVRADMREGADGARLLIEIADTGIGIAPDRREAIFEQFVQSDVATAHRYGGTGLGLAISSQLARLMHGTLDLASTPGVGTTFTLALPLEATEAPAALDPLMPADLPSHPAPVLPRDAGAPRILLAEDHDINELLTTELLRRLGCRTDVARDGGEAVARVQEAEQRGEPYALVLMDVQMPVIDGVEATRRLRASGITAERLPIVALTANAFADDVEMCLAAGMQAHVAKPVRMADLDAVLGRWTGRAPAPAATQAPPSPGAALSERFRERKQAVLDHMAMLVRTGAVDDASLEDLREMLHKLAGSAGMFGEAALGDHAAALEDELPRWTAPDRAERLAGALDRLRRAG